MDVFRYNTATYIPFEELVANRRVNKDFYIAYRDRLKELANTAEPILVAIDLCDDDMFKEIFDYYQRLDPIKTPIRVEDMYHLANNMGCESILEVIEDKMGDKIRNIPSYARIEDMVEEPDMDTDNL